VLSQLPYPDPLLKDLLTEHFPDLIEHAQNIQRLVYKNGPPPSSSAPQGLALTSLIPWPRWKAVAPAPVEQSDEWKRLQRSFAMQRWGLIALATVGAVGYFWTYGLPLTIRLGGGHTDNEDEDPEHVHEPATT
jgi:hypothetical protein